MNEAILKKVQAIYGAPSLESVNPMTEPENTEEEVFDETPALEAYSEEELELLHQEIVEEYTAAMETITPELANLEYTIMLESVGLSLDRFNEFEGVVSMEAVKKAVKDGKVTKDSAFKSIAKRIVDLFWTMVDHVTGNYINVLKYGKLVQKYIKKLESLDVRALSELEMKKHFTITDVDAFVKIVEDNAKTMKKFAGFGKSGNDPKANITYIYSIFKDLGINYSKADSYVEHFKVKADKFRELAEMKKGDATVLAPNDLKKKLIENGNAIIKSLNSVAIKGFRDQIKAAKAKLKAGAVTTNDMTDDQKKAINADLKRCMALISGYKTYNKECIGIVKKNVSNYLTGVGAFIDAVNAANKKDEKKEETK